MNIKNITNEWKIKCAEYFSSSHDYNDTNFKGKIMG